MKEEEKGAVEEIDENDDRKEEEEADDDDDDEEEEEDDEDASLGMVKGRGAVFASFGSTVVDAEGLRDEDEKHDERATNKTLHADRIRKRKTNKEGERKE